MSARNQILLSPLLIALAALAATLATIAPDGNGPGVTCDEPYHVYEGKQLVTALRQQGWAFFRPANIERNFAWKIGGPPVQAPLGYWILGWTHYVFDPAPDNPNVISITAARFAPAVAFAVLILMVGGWTGRREGPLAGAVAAAAVALMPRLFGHAHLAVLDMLTTLFFVAAVLAAAEAARGGRGWHYAAAGAVWGAAMLVRLHGLLLAPPVVAWLIWRWYRHERKQQCWGGNCTAAPGATVQLSPQWGSRSSFSLARGMAAWLAGGVMVVFVGWPWLWLAPFARFRQYLASGTARQAIHVFYMGQVWNDRDVPWHYPWVMFAVTVPVGPLVLGMLGMWAQWRDGRRLRSAETKSPLALGEEQGLRASEIAKCKLQNANCKLSGSNPQSPIPNPSANCPHPSPLPGGGGTLLAGVMLFVLVVFSLPGSHVYDGVRLFLMVFPLWAVWVGIGAKWLVARGNAVFTSSRWAGPPRGVAEQDGGQARRLNVRITAAVLLFIVLQGLGLLIYSPSHLSYYNLLIGGLAGAERLGFEATYWGDTVREPMLAEAARLSPHGQLLFVPNLAPFQAWAVEVSSPALHDAHVRVAGWDESKPEEAKSCRYAVIYHRRADLAGAKRLLEGGKVVQEYSQQGVWLARLVELRPLRAASQAGRINRLL